MADRAGMAELADAVASGATVLSSTCGFDSRSLHHGSRFRVSRACDPPVGVLQTALI